MGDSRAGPVERIERIGGWIVRRAPWVLLVTLAVAIASLSRIVDLRSGAARLRLDPSIDGILPQDDPERARDEALERLFSSGEEILLALAADDVFTADNLRRIQTISREVEDLGAVDRVASLSLSLNIRSEDGTLRIDPFYDEVPESAEELADLRQRALADPIYAGNLISRDGRVALVLVRLLDLPEREILASGIDDRIRAIARRHWTDGAFWMSGGVHVKAEMSRLMLRDTNVVVPIAALVMSLVAFAAFRTLRGVLIPLCIVAISTLVTLAFMAMAYGSLNQITAAVPSVMIVVGFAYSMHVIAAYYDALRNAPRGGPQAEGAALVALREVATPVLFTGFTTAAGFASLATSSLPAIQQYAVATAIGVLASMGATLCFGPALLALLPARAPRRRAHSTDRIDASLVRLAKFDIAHRTPILVAGAAIALFSGIGLPRIVVGSDMVSSLKPDNPVRRDFASINARLEGANSIHVILTTSAAGGFENPESLEAIDALQRRLDGQHDIGGSTSFADYVKALYRGIQGGDPSFYRIPESRELVSQLLVLGDNDELDQYVDAGFRTANIVVRTSAMDSTAILDLERRIETELRGLPRHIRARLTGNSILVSHTMDDIAIGQVKSLATAFVIIYLILVLLFTSFGTGAVAMLPNILPVLVYFGILGWSGVQLNASTGLVATIVLGIAVDDTIHLLATFNRTAKRYADESRGVVEALRGVGRPVTVTTLSLCLGFLCLTFSEMQPQVEFGALSAVTLLTAWLVDVTVTPALAARMQIVTLWDVLTLDLGDAPQRSIPLFAGLTETQARIAALIARIDAFGEGREVIKNGAEGDEMYVVIDGELEASVYRGDRKVLLRRLARGDVVGEVALFHGRRTADVVATTDVRLLRITQHDFENIQRRHPRIGAQLYANLNTVLADRMAELTTRTDASTLEATR